MSHFSQIKTQIRDLTALQSALTDLEIQWKSGPHAVRGYRGQTHMAEIVIEQENGYDIGFSYNNQSYELVADLQYWQQPLSVQGFLNRNYPALCLPSCAARDRSSRFSGG